MLLLLCDLQGCSKYCMKMMEHIECSVFIGEREGVGGGKHKNKSTGER